jgi:hypothetical protein
MSAKSKHDDRIKVRAHPSRSTNRFKQHRRRFSGVHDSRGYEAQERLKRIAAGLE